jgi:large subunit ribosomal protein L21
MYAVIQAGGHQYRVAKGDVLEVDLLPGDVGSTVTFDRVLLLGDQSNVTLGSPHIVGASVEATIQAQTRAPKIIVFKYKRRKNYKKKRGHKQPLTVIEVTGIHA